MKKAIVVAHNSRFIVQFELRNIRLLQSMGYEVHCATNFLNEESILDAKEQIEATGAVLHQFDIERFRFSPRVLLKNVRACTQLKRILEDGYDIVHCHTPIGGVVARIAAAKERNKGTKVIYTAHGFHFFKGAPLINWLIYYPVEWALAHLTDVLITINKEDYARAQKFKAKKVCYVPGVGIDLSKFKKSETTRDAKREELGLDNEDFVLLSVGELIPRKNHQIVLKALAEFKNTPEYERIQYLVCGRGALESELKALANNLGIADKVHFLGYRSDIPDICNCSDLFVFMSLQEGLPVALMEAMATGLPCVASRIRGNTDLLDGQQDLLIEPDDVKDCAERIKTLLEMKPEERNELKRRLAKAVDKFSLDEVRKIIRNIYEQVQ